MTRILHFSSGPDDWKALLSDPEKHWRSSYSVKTLAHCWESADGFPPEVADALVACDEALLQNLTPIVAVPEFKVQLPGGSRASQNDIFVLAHSRTKAVVMMVEGKVKESFGPTLEEWAPASTPGKKERWEFLLETLALDQTVPLSLRYQLFHRAASAVLEGNRYRASAAVLLVHSFNEDRAGWNDYEHFLELFDVQAVESTVQLLTKRTSVPLYAGWVLGDCRFLES